MPSSGAPPHRRDDLAMRPRRRNRRAEVGVGSAIALALLVLLLLGLFVGWLTWSGPGLPFGLP